MLTFRKRMWRDRLQSIRWAPRFLPIDLAFGFVALFANPYRTARKFLQKKRERDIYAYGETPLMTYRRMAEICEIGPSDVWLELGAGRGKGCFWMSQITCCRVIGIEWIPQFMIIAKIFKILFRVKKASFYCQDFNKADLTVATCIYIYGSLPKQPLPQGVKIIAISEPIPTFPIIKTFWVRYPWGRTQAFLQMR